MASEDDRYLCKNIYWCHLLYVREYWFDDAVVVAVIVQTYLFNLQRVYYVLGLFCRKPWFTEVINISPMDQTKCFQLRTALLWESAYGCMTTRRLIIQWSQKILIIDITKVALRSKASNNSNITWMEYENNTFPIKESPCPRVAHV